MGCSGQLCGMRRPATPLPQKAAQPLRSGSPDAVLQALIGLSRSEQEIRFAVSDAPLPAGFAAAPPSPPPRFFV